MSSPSAEYTIRDLLFKEVPWLEVHMPTGKVVKSSLAAERLFGYEPVGLIGRAVEELMPVEFRERHIQHRAEFAAKPGNRRMGVGPVPLHAQKADGTTFPVEIGLYGDELGYGKGYVVVVLHAMPK